MNDCCMQNHMMAKAPWTCPCACHEAPPPETLSRKPGEPLPDCPRCGGTGECDNAQFQCPCRHHFPHCELIYGQGNCDCMGPSAPDPRLVALKREIGTVRELLDRPRREKTADERASCFMLDKWADMVSDILGEK